MYDMYEFSKLAVKITRDIETNNNILKGKVKLGKHVMYRMSRTCYCKVIYLKELPGKVIDFLYKH